MNTDKDVLLVKTGPEKKEGSKYQTGRGTFSN